MNELTQEEMNRLMYLLYDIRQMLLEVEIILRGDDDAEDSPVIR
jgi:hypothetical protein